MKPVYHFTCSHAAPHIDADGAVKPMVSWRRMDAALLHAGEHMTGLWRAPAVVWCTHEPIPDRTALGLTSYTLACDRTEFRYTVEGPTMPWLDFLAQYTANPDWLRTMTGDPSLWLVATEPLRVVEKLDRRRRVA
jgi:hypothetical protein